jgi:hypothetical protein
MIQLGGGIPCISIMGIFPGDRQVGMTEAFLNIERVCACFQEARGMGVTQRVEIEQRHSQLFMNDAIGMLQ